MERITKKDTAKDFKEKLLKLEKAIDKLGQIEDIEEKLGIDLITLFIALENGWWYYDYIDKKVYYIPETYKSLRFCLIGICLECEIDGKMKLFPIKRYKQKYIGGWALTKEDLENE